MKSPAIMTTDEHRNMRAPSEPVRVMYCHSTSYIGGGNKVLLELFRKLDRSRFAPISLIPDRGPIEEDLDRLRVPCVALDLSPHTSGRLGKLQRIAQLVHHCVQGRIGLLHVNDPITYRLASVGAAWARVPVVCHVHHPSETTESLKWAFARAPKLVVTPSNFMACRVREMLSRDTKFPVEGVWNQVDSDWFRPAEDVARLRSRLEMDPAGNHLCMVGAIAPHKGHDCLLAAMPRIIERRPGTVLHVVGSTLTGSRQFAQQLHETVASLGIERNVRFWGFVPDETVRDIVCASDLAVLPSREEGFCLVAAEAQACKVPVVASAIPPFDEVIDDGRTGLLVRCGDPAAFAGGILRLLESDDERRRMGEAGRAWVVENFSCDRYARRIGQLYEEVLQSKTKTLPVELLETDSHGGRQSAMTAARQPQRAIGFDQFLVSPELGGAGLVALDIASHIQNLGFAPCVWIPGDGRARAEADRRRLPGAQYDPGVIVGHSTFSAGREIMRIVRHLRRRRPGVVHVHSPLIYGALRRGLKFAGHKRVAHVQIEEQPETLRWAFQDPPDAIVTCARFLTEQVRAAIPDARQEQVRVVAVPNAVDLTRYMPGGNRAEAKVALGANPNVPLLLMMANLAPHKGQETAIQAVALLKSRNIDVQCWLAGCEREQCRGFESKLRDLVKSAGVEKEVRFLGFRDDGPELIRATDLILLPSAHEGLPLSILEAQASGVPVLAAPVAGVPEVITHEQTGLLIAHDDPQGYAHWIGRLLSTPALYERLAEQAYDRVCRENSAAAFMEQIWNLYRELLSPMFDGELEQMSRRVVRRS